jgi:hypothetical protein
MRKTNDREIIRMHDEGKTGVEIAAHFAVSPAAISKRLKRLLPAREPESFDKLTDKQKKWVLAKAEGKSNTSAAMEAFDVTSRESAKAVGHKLAQDPDINLALTDLMAQEGITRRHRVQRLRAAIDHPDPNVSLKGLDQGWRLEALYGVEAPIVQLNFNALILEAKAIDKEIEKLERNLKELSEGKSDDQN